MDFFKKDDLTEEQKREIAFQTVAGLRDTVFFATRKPQPPTYEQALRLVHDLDEDLYNQFIHLLTEKNDNDTVKLYKEEAKIQSIGGKVVDPADLIKRDIERYKQLEQEGKFKGENVQHIKRRIAILFSGLENLKPRRVNENAILTRDFAQVDRSDIFGEKIFSDYKHIDYSLSRGRFLRLRLLHPDEGEHLTGADLVYEQYDVVSGKMRFIFLQYKTWNNGTIYFSQQKNLASQLDKLKQTLCDCNYCDAHKDDTQIEFRFPYCSGFLRPTDKLQHKNSKMVSSGYHIPICNALKYHEQFNKIDKAAIKYSSPNHYMFEKLFNQNLVGSRWLDTDEVEAYYKAKNILEPDETLKLYAREIINKKSSEWKETEDDENPF